MRIYKEKDYAALCQRAANIIAAQIVYKPSSVLGLATGSSPIGVYEDLAARCARKELSFSRITTINLDEYKGLAPDNDQSYRYFMTQNLFSHINIKRENTNVPDGLNQDSDVECTRYDSLIQQSGPIDLQLLGIGNNGHIGFNEPADEFIPHTHVVDLTESTIEANKRFFEKAEDVPRQAYTMGIAPIMQAKHILLIATGAGKADIVREAFFGPVTPKVPASILQLHGHFTLVGDEEALSKI